MWEHEIWNAHVWQAGRALVLHWLRCQLYWRPMRLAHPVQAHWAPLADALAVVEFVRMFGGFIGAEPITLQVRLQLIA